MSNISQFVSKDEIQEQASLWISRLDRGLDNEEKSELVTWIQQSQNHRTALYELAVLWDDLSVLNELSGLFPLKHASKHDSNQVNRRMTQAKWSIAASFLVMAIALGSLVDWSFLAPKPAQTIVTTSHFKTNVGDQKNIKLSDGSLIHLNTDSEINVAYSSKRRFIELVKGEAHFTVAHNKMRPFIVSAGNNTVTAVGTAFNMQFVDDDAFELVVTEGRVMVKAFENHEVAGQPLTVKEAGPEEGLLMFSGEKAHIQGQIDQRENMSLNAMEEDLAWQKGMIVFKGEPLEMALKEIGRYTPVEFEIKDEIIKTRRVAGFFKVGDIDGLLHALEQSFGIAAQRTDAQKIILQDAG